MPSCLNLRMQIVHCFWVVVVVSVFARLPQVQAQDCNNNSVPDVQDIDPTDPDGNGQVSEDCNADGEPDECDVQTSRLLGASATHLVEIDRTTFVQTPIMPIPADIDCMAYHAGLDLVFLSDNESLWSIDLTTEVLVLRGQFSTTTFEPRSLMYDSIGDRLLGASRDRIFEIDPVDASPMTIDSFPCCETLAYAFYPPTGQLVRVDFSPWSLINRQTGAIEDTLSSLFGAGDIRDMVFDSSTGDFWGLSTFLDSRISRVFFDPQVTTTGQLVATFPEEARLFALTLVELDPAAALAADMDCNANAIPDSCEIAACTDDSLQCSDCDADGVLDVCKRAFAEFQGIISEPVALPSHRPHTVALDGEFLGVYWARLNNATTTDVVRTYRRVGDEWQFQQEIPVGTGNSGVTGNIGRYLDMDRGNLAVFNPGSSSEVLFYRRDETGMYVDPQAVIAPTGIQDYGGTALDLNGPLLAAGVPSPSLGFGPDKVVIMRQSFGTWGVDAIIDGPEDSSTFGRSVAISGDTLLVGDHFYFYESFSFPGGLCHLYRYDGSEWIATQQFDDVFGDLPGINQLGISTAIEGDWAAIGAVGCNAFIFDCAIDAPGYVQLLKRDPVTNQWMRDVVIERPSEHTPLAFGISVDMDRDHLVVGALDVDAGSLRGSSAYVYEQENGVWNLISELRLDTGFISDTHGRSVAIDGGRIAVADGLTFDVFNVIKRVYTFQFHTDLNDDGRFDVCEINAGAADLDRDFVPDAFDPDCNGDGIADRDSLADNDCNRNGVPDDCELDATDPDGDGNTLEDCNGDQIPDDCQINLYNEFDELFVSQLPPGSLPASRVAASADWAVNFFFIDTLGDFVGVGERFVAVFRRVGGRWQFFQALGAADAQVQDTFGIAADVDGDSMVIVGTSSTGPIMNFYRFDGNVWVLETELPIPAVATSLAYVMLLEDTAVVGLPREVLANGSDGVAYVFQRENGSWEMDERLDGPASRVPYDGFGSYVEISRDEIFVSSNDNFVTVFQRTTSTWQASQIITPPPGFTVNGFGVSMAAEERRLVIGCRSFTTPTGSSNNGVFYYRKQGVNWSLNQILLDFGDSNPATSFGVAVDMNGGLLAVSATGRRPEFEPGTLAGSVSLFRINPLSNQFTPLELVRPFPDVRFRSFGRSMALSGGQILATNEYFEPTSPYGKSVTAVGGTRDVDGNGVMDYCELDGNDCNGNGVLDRVEPDYADLDYFLDVMLADTGASSPCQFDTNDDGAINGGDIAGFVSRLIDE